MNKKDDIVITYSCFGKNLKMEFNKAELIEDYRTYCALEIMSNENPKTIKMLLQEKLCECLSELLVSEHKCLHYRY